MDSLGNDTLGNDTHPACDDFKLRLWMLYSLIPAVAILTLFCLLEQRVNLWKSCFQGRPGVAFPVNLVDSYTHRWSFAFAFGSMSTIISAIYIEDQNIIEVDESSVADMLQGTVKFLVLATNGLIISMVFYPILLCLRTKRVLGNVIGLGYSCSWLIYYICSIALRCNRSTKNGAIFQIIEELGTNGSGAIFFLALVIHFTLVIVKAIKLLKKNENEPEADFTKTHFYHRVAFLLRPSLPADTSANIIVRLFRRFIGTVPGFRFSRHNICTLVLTIVTTIQVALVFMSVLGPSVDILSQQAEASYWISNIVAIIVTLVFTTDIQLRYRKHTLKLWRGDRSFYSQGNVKVDARMLVSSMRYTGYQVAYAASGFQMMQLLLWGIAWFAISFIDDLWLTFQKYWLTLFIAAAFFIGQIYISQLAFLQREPNQGKFSLLCNISSVPYLGLNNRRVFHVTLYIMLFINFLIGIVSFFYRILKAIVLETIFIGRLDRCVLMRDWELWDQGFRSYIGFLELEVAHTHPVVITFCHFLLQSVNTRWSYNELGSIINAEGGYEARERSANRFVSSGELSTQLVSRQMRNKWLVALTLARNPKLVSERKQVLIEARKKKRPPIGDSFVAGETDA